MKALPPLLAAVLLALGGPCRGADFGRLQQLALQGDAGAQYELASLYAFGDVPPGEPDPDRMAARWYFEAAQQGHADAQYALGLFFFSGKGVVQSRDEALKWLRRAAASGHADARRFLGENALPAAR